MTTTYQPDPREPRGAAPRRARAPRPPGLRRGAPCLERHVRPAAAAIARVQGAVDVVAVVNHAREAGLELAVRGGGHSSAGYSTVDGGLVLDLSRMRGVRVDPLARVAHAQAGALWGDVDRETQAHGLAVPGGQISHTGIAGLTLGGGIGWLSRKHGLTIDNLLSVDLVTADGRLVRASATEHPDLFWGLRGGSGNFGVVVSFEYRLHEVGPLVLGGPILYGLDDAAAALRNARDVMADAPDDVSLWLVLTHVSSALPVPEELHGRRCSPSSRSAPTSSAAPRCWSRSRRSGRRSDASTGRSPTPCCSPRSTASTPMAIATGSGATTSPACPTRRSTRRRRRADDLVPPERDPPLPDGRRRRTRPLGGDRLRGPLGAVGGVDREPVDRPRRGRPAPRVDTRLLRDARALDDGGGVRQRDRRRRDDARKAAAYGGPAKLERLRELKRAWDPRTCST